MIFVQEKYKRKMFSVEGSIEQKSIFVCWEKIQENIYKRMKYFLRISFLVVFHKMTDYSQLNVN